MSDNIYDLNGVPAAMTAECKDTSSNTDVFSGTPLGIERDAGLWRIQIASTVNTATVAISGPGQEGTGPNAQEVELWTNGVPTKDTHIYNILLKQKGRPTVALAGTTGTVYTRGAYYPMADYLASLSKR